MGVCLLILATLPQLIVEVVKFSNIVLKIPETLPQVIVEVMYVGQVFPATLRIVIAEDMLIEVNIGHKRPSNLPISISKQGLMLKGEVDICLRPTTISP